MWVARVILAGIFASICCEAAKVSDAQWLAAIDMTSRNLMLTQKMSKEFLFVALDMDVSGNTQAMLGTINTYDTSLNNLV